MRFSPHTAPRSILSKSLDPFPRSRISSLLPFRPEEWLGPIQSRFHSFGIWALLRHFYLLIFGLFFPLFSFFYFFFYSLPSFLKSHRFDPSDPFFHWARGTKEIRLIFRSKVLCEIFVFFLFLYPYPRVQRLNQINREPFLLYLYEYESILLHSNSFPIPPEENPELDPKLTG